MEAFAAISGVFWASPAHMHICVPAGNLSASPAHMHICVPAGNLSESNAILFYMVCCLHIVTLNLSFRTEWGGGGSLTIDLTKSKIACAALMKSLPKNYCTRLSSWKQTPAMCVVFVMCDVFYWQ